MGAAIIGLIGVFLGVFLGAGYEEWKSRRNRKTLKEALIEELRSNLQMVPQKKDIVKQIISHLNKDKLLPGSGTRFIRIFYETYFPSIFPDLNIKERNSFHILYEYFRIVDWLLESYSECIVESMGTERVNEYIRLYLAMMKDILNLLNLAEKLITNHLAGNPEDVLYSEVDHVKLIQAKYGADT
jgi:hypothetical protein